ncbi:MAG: protein kinase [Solirubrobacterales bacterium]|nr:protein kinase [Solirubrobacterales bacterium]MBV9714717.1 protein kinase [Solirubrobacterales bacterium]
MANATMIAGRYRIDGRLGVGGMSTVHLAFDQRLERYVAIKLLAEHLADDPAFVSRFRREALSAARLVHPNIVQVFDFGLDEHQHQHFIVMEHVPGQSCAEILRDRGHLDVDQAVDILAQACRGLDYAHRHGVVHRDVKPGNLLVSEADVVKLADFGIARATDQSSITQVGSVLGTAAYLAPEQARGEEAGPRADLYSLGVVAYQLISGRLPYEAASLSELTLKQQREPPPPLNRIDPSVPPELAGVVAGALSIDQEDRPVNATVLADALRRGARGVGSELDSAPTAYLGGTAATNVLPPRPEPRTAATRAAVSPPQLSSLGTPRRRAEPQAEPRRATGAYPPPDRAARRRNERRAGRRMLALLLAAVVFVAVVAVAISLAASTSNSAVHLRKVIAHDANSAVSQVKSLVDQNTK